MYREIILVIFWPSWAFNKFFQFISWTASMCVSFTTYKRTHHLVSKRVTYTNQYAPRGVELRKLDGYLGGYQALCSLNLIDIGYEAHWLVKFLFQAYWVVSRNHLKPLILWHCSRRNIRGNNIFMSIWFWDIWVCRDYMQNRVQEYNQSYFVLETRYTLY